jgi:hypothetical protein
MMGHPFQDIGTFILEDRCSGNARTPARLGDPDGSGVESHSISPARAPKEYLGSMAIG